MIEERLKWPKLTQDRVDVQQSADKLEASIDHVGALVSGVTLQSKTLAIFATL